MGRDLRHYAQQTMVRLIIGGIALLFIVGDGLIYIFYGQEAAFLGFLCLAAGLSPLVLTWLLLMLLDFIVGRRQER